MRIIDGKLESVQELLLKMSASVEESMEKSIRSLLTKRMDLANEVIALDLKTDELEERIENMCINIIATQQPMGSDLRRLTAIIKLITDLERIGDYSVNIAEIVLEIGDEALIKPLVDIPRMAEVAKLMIRRSISAYINMDAALAKEAALMDEEVDTLYRQVYTDLLSLLMKDPSTMKQTMQLLFIGRYLERIADHATNICERVIYMVTGMREHY